MHRLERLGLGSAAAQQGKTAGLERDFIAHKTAKNRESFGILEYHAGSVAPTEFHSATAREKKGAARWVPRRSERRGRAQLSAREGKGKGARLLPGWAAACWAAGRRNWAARGEKGEGVLGRDGEKEKERFCLFFFFFLFLFIKSLLQIHLKICLNHFQTLVKITHLRNKMHQHVLHTIVAKPYDKFYFKEKYYSFFFIFS